jgi:hypothetical protein
MRAKVLTVVLSACLIGVVSVSPNAQSPQAPQAPTRKLELTFDGAGNVTLIAQGVTVQEVLAEWSRRGGSVIDGAARLAGGPISVQFGPTPEVQVLESLLRNASGLILLPRLAGTPGASRLDVRILATSNPSQMFSSAGSGVMTPPVSTAGSPDDEVPPVTPVPVANAPGQVQSNPQAPPRPPTGVSPVVPVVPISPVPTTAPGQTGRGRGGL